MSELQFDDSMRVMLDVKLSVEYCKADGFWYWCHNDEVENMDLWHGPFSSYFRAMADAIAPYVEESEG